MRTSLTATDRMIFELLVQISYRERNVNSNHKEWGWRPRMSSGVITILVLCTWEPQGYILASSCGHTENGIPCTGCNRQGMFFFRFQNVFRRRHIPNADAVVLTTCHDEFCIGAESRAKRRTASSSRSCERSPVVAFVRVKYPYGIPDFLRCDEEMLSIRRKFEA